MKIVVALKQVPDDTARVPVGADGRRLPDGEQAWILSPLDRYALEQAFRLREAGGGEIVVAHVGADHAPSVLMEGLALGADRALCAWDPSLGELDSLATARILAAAINKVDSVDLVLTGHRGVGEDVGQVPGLLAGLLDWPQITLALDLELAGPGRLRARREVEAGHEIWETSLPAVVSAQKGPLDPRQRSLKGVLGAKKKPFTRLGRADLGLDEVDLAPRLRIEKVEVAPERPACRVIPGEPNAQVEELVRLLRQEGRLA